ncbi:aldose epimerase family protein [Microbacterium saperdae]|uniref:Galactose mutarotase-like enzyme n=1 Tax=Microbacterium saperdae TaxID=69368 RepID=A0A543BIV5_9MICO|nr:DUF4432 family protein [Microbacterium saperdae]TQL84721.1 galactose mutarotase-like enzyme [Microbacterium saperdae]GGM64661.1 hypothetical protein GCM10010489_40270 [Microbacterium saperdae]
MTTPVDTLAVVDEILDGDRCLHLSNERMTVSINVDHGAHLYALIDRRSGVDLLYKDPAGSRGYAVGGWYELFPNAGVACDFGGRPLTAHGDVQHAVWSAEVTAAAGSEIVVALSCVSADLPFALSKTITLSTDAAVLRIEETITNTSARRTPYLWGQHLTFGEAFLQGALIDVPDGPLRGTVVVGAHDSAPHDPATGALASFPTVAGDVIDLRRFPDDAVHAMLFSERLAAHRYAIAHADLDIRAEVSWDGDAWPYLWFWALRESRGGGIIACAIEPQASDVPVLTEALAAGRCPSLDGGEVTTAWIEFRLGETADG